MFDVGEHRLYLRCTGTGLPTVVYLHGYIFDPGGGGSANAGAFPGLLEPSHRVCVYDRVNVGLSDPSPGPLTGATSVEDLHALLEVAGIKGPLVLVGASYGGLIAYMYAATYPQEVVGMVLLDAVLPDEPGDADWQYATEQLDQHATTNQAMALAGSEPQVPMTYIGIEDGDVGPVISADAYRKAVAELRVRQQRLVERFAPGRLIVLDVPHFMEPGIPDGIAQEVELVIAAGGWSEPGERAHVRKAGGR